MASEKARSRFRESGLSSPPSVNADSPTLEKLEGGGSRPISQHSPEWPKAARPGASPHGSFYGTGAQALELPTGKDPALVSEQVHFLFSLLSLSKQDVTADLMVNMLCVVSCGSILHPSRAETCRLHTQGWFTPTFPNFPNNSQSPPNTISMYHDIYLTPSRSQSTLRVAQPFSAGSMSPLQLPSTAAGHPHASRSRRTMAPTPMRPMTQAQTWSLLLLVLTKMQLCPWHLR
jgi:hypothetical protein